MNNVKEWMSHTLKKCVTWISLQNELFLKCDFIVVIGNEIKDQNVNRFYFINNVITYKIEYL